MSLLILSSKIPKLPGVVKCELGTSKYDTRWDENVMGERGRVGKGGGGVGLRVLNLLTVVMNEWPLANFFFAIKNEIYPLLLNSYFHCLTC